MYCIYTIIMFTAGPRGLSHEDSKPSRPAAPQPSRPAPPTAMPKAQQEESKDANGE